MAGVKKRIEYLLKHNTGIQFVYRHCVSALFRTIGLFIRTDDSLVLFNASGGRKFGDSPKVLFDAMTQDSRFAGCRFVWAFEKPENFQIENAQVIRIDSWTYFKTALKGGIWISSVNIERGLHFKKRKTVYVNTWHGAGTKKIGNACNGRKDYNFSAVDMMLVQSDFERDIFLRDFLCNPEAIRKIGFPRNDELFQLTPELKKKYRKQFDIPDNKKVILYAPTWRESRDGGLSYEFIPPIRMEKWKERLSDEYVMLFRMHPFTTQFEMHYDDFARNVSSYENLNHVLAITDVLITDYSTIVYDASIAGIPFICFGFDYDRYSEERGFYFDLRQVYPGGVLTTEDQVLDRIPEMISGKDREQFKAFRDRYVEAGGTATQQILDELAKRAGKTRLSERL
ncbi:MAG: CDP-glycerol glycerophosphotransferase family protein [Clostridia bacterium]|nr:CDP-glycerol glycerophosphotransferase family protein [Clostridia bacterium]MBR4576564.1 CDP-glycerol glycerophosphotransferase family protein [Clostridia bacterium]